MFSDRFDLTNLVLEGIKTCTRRLEKKVQKTVPQDRKILQLDLFGYDEEDSKRYAEVKMYDPIIGDMWYEFKPHFDLDSEVAVAQSYCVAQHHYNDEARTKYLELIRKLMGANYEDRMCWTNKMNILPALMPYRIYITNIRLEHLQDISDEDCIKEGIQIDKNHGRYTTYYFHDNEKNTYFHYFTPKEAYAALINAISGKGTWEKNPLVVVYDFKLMPRVPIMEVVRSIPNKLLAL